MAPALGLKGECELRLGQAETAVQTLESGLVLAAEDARLWLLLGTALTDLGRLEPAREAFDRALHLDPSSGGALSSLLFTQRQLCQWEGLDRLLERFRAGLARGQDQLAPFAFLAEDSGRNEQRRCAELWSRQWPVTAGPQTPLPDAGQPLTIGYLSADFHRHPTAYLAAGLFEAHDRSRFRVIGYSNGPDDGSAIRKRLEAAFDVFVDLRGMTPDEAAARMVEDGVHVLVDLKGHTLDAAPEVLARRPAPIQAHYLGYPGTIAAPWVDYLVGDPWVTPPQHEDDYAEAIVRLPDAYQVNDRLRPRPDSTGRRSDHGLPDNGVVFCCFNNSWKLNAEVLNSWAAILDGVPGSVLWLLGRQSAPSVAKALRQRLGALGLAPERLVFSKSRPLVDYLALYHHADLFLDSWPYNAHTTASDALWMGCPVLSWPGESYAGRVGASLLSACGQEALICADEPEYRKRAIALGNAPDRLSVIRKRLTEQRDSLPLFDTEATTRALEWAFEEMARQARTGAIESFDVPRPETGRDD